MQGILGALVEEVEALAAAIQDPQRRAVFGVEVQVGHIDGVQVALARSGVGKVNATLATAALAEVGVTSIVFTGVAGGVDPGLRVGDIVVATDLVQHDVDVTAMGYAPGQLLGEPASWHTDDALSAALLSAAQASAGPGVNVMAGRIASGDQFVASPAALAAIRNRFGALATEMEGAAVAQACKKLAVPCAVLRVISDAADHDAPTDFPAFLASAARTGTAIVRKSLSQCRVV